MEIKEFQNKVDELIEGYDKKLNCKHNINNTFIHIIEELGEVANELNKPNIRNEELRKKELGEELSDVIIFLTRLANLNEIDLEKAINEKMSKVRERYNI